MSGSQTNEVETFSAEGRVSVKVAPTWKAGRLKTAVGDKLGLKFASLPLFGLFEGPLDAPNRSELFHLTCFTYEPTLA